jgi:site-specific DNA recombinase
MNCDQHYNPVTLQKRSVSRAGCVDFMTKRVIELIRVSTEGQASNDRASIPSQRAANRRTCAQYGLQIVQSIEISDVSGACVLLAPEMQQLIHTMRSADIHGVVAREFSRLMRPENFEDFALLQAFVDSKTVLYLPEGPLDFNSKTGRLMGTIRAAIAGMERTEILERIWSAKEEKRRRGELAQSSIVLPFGVGYDASRGFYYKPEAERVRDAFRQFLAGNQSYSKLSELVGVTPRGMHLIMRNPIYTGWRVIDKKRDLSAAGRYPTVNGRQADRKKVTRAPEDIIRIRVIADPLVSEEDFRAAQQIMDLKQKKHWRSQPNIEHRFIYNGFLSCSACGEIVHTAYARRDYYTCKGRRTLHTCKSRYMVRETLEARLDSLFSDELTNRKFLQRCITEIEQRQARQCSANRIQRLEYQISNLREKRARVLEAFLDGVISKEDRDARLKTVDRDLLMVQESLADCSPTPEIDIKQLIEAFAPLVEWEHWTRDQKRSVLSTIAPDIRVANYEVTALSLNSTLFSNDDTHRGTGS